MKLFGKNIDKDKLLYGGLIITFIILYGATAFVSWYHAITFFNIANAVWLSVLLSFVAEIGQASVLFSILLTKNKHKFLPWAVMIILTTLQVIGNVVSSYDWIIKHNGEGVDAFQKSILFWMQAADPEIFKVVIAWISGALLPIIALSMTALVAQNMQLRAGEELTELDPVPPLNHEGQPDIQASDIISEVSKVRPTEEELSILDNILKIKKPITEIPKEDSESDFLSKEVQKERKESSNKISEKFISNLEKILDNKKPIEKVPVEEGPIIETEVPFDELLPHPDENVEEFDPNDFDIPDEEDEFGSVDLTNEVPDIIPPKVVISQDNGLVNIEPIEEKTIDETPPPIELEKKPDETPEIKKSSVQPPPVEHFTPEQLERIRQIARERLLKKK